MFAECVLKSMKINQSTDLHLFSQLEFVEKKNR